MSINNVFQDINHYLNDLDIVGAITDYSYYKDEGFNGLTDYEKLSNYIKEHLDGKKINGWDFELIELNKVVFGKTLENSLFNKYREGFKELGFSIGLVVIPNKESMTTWKNNEEVELTITTLINNDRSESLLAFPQGIKDAQKYFLNY
ncbi:hypothetical protein GF352_02825 [archaeon]|nr:hypothetical protein [archaeon]